MLAAQTSSQKQLLFCSHPGRKLLPTNFSFFRESLPQDKFDYDKGQKSAISGRRLHWRLSTGFFAFSPVFMCNLVRRAP